MERFESLVSRNRTAARILIGIFCIFIAVCVGIVMAFVYRPSQNALGALSSVSMDIVTMCILMILVGNFIFEAKAMNRTSKWFFCLVLATIWALFLDYLNWAFDGSLAYDGITYWFTIGSLCMGSVLACLFSVYLYVFMSELHGLTKMYKVAKVCAGLNLVSFALTFALALTKTAFDFVDGHYETGALYDVVTVIPVLTLLFLTGYLMHQIKVVGLHDIVAVTGYIIFMIAGALCEAAYSIGTTYVAVAIADVFIFIMLQNRVIAEERRNVKIWIEKSNTDELTGFYNRHAYEADMTELENSRLADNFVYVSIDVNGLKVENDTKGHAAGDELLLHASECLKQCFGSYGKIYRTGGDEFVALIFTDDSQLEAIKKDIVEVSGGTVSCGFVTSKEAHHMTVRQMAVFADKRMYEDKAAYYKRSGAERRGV